MDPRVREVLHRDAEMTYDTWKSTEPESGEPPCADCGYHQCRCPDPDDHGTTAVNKDLAGGHSATPPSCPPSKETP